MNRKVSGFVILGIVFVVLSIVVFIVPTSKTDTFCTVYIFTVISFAVQIIILRVLNRNDTSIRSRFLGLPIAYVGIAYLAAQIVVLVAFTIFPNVPVWIAAVICVLVLGISALCLVSVKVGTSEIERVDEKVSEKVLSLKSLGNTVEMIAYAEKDEDTKAALKQLADKIRFSDPMSGNDLGDLEQEIRRKVDQLEHSEDKRKTIGEIDLLLEERNRKCMQGK